jgi:hypothetical protein
MCEITVLWLIKIRYVNPIGIERLTPRWRFYTIYCCWIAIELLVVCFFYIETKGPTLEEIAKIFDGDEYETEMRYIISAPKLQNVEHGSAELNGQSMDLRRQPSDAKYGIEIQTSIHATVDDTLVTSPPRSRPPYAREPSDFDFGRPMEPSSPLASTSRIRHERHEQNESYR